MQEDVRVCPGVNNPVQATHVKLHVTQWSKTSESQMLFSHLCSSQANTTQKLTHTHTKCLDRYDITFYHLSHRSAIPYTSELLLCLHSPNHHGAS